MCPKSLPSPFQDTKIENEDVTERMGQMRLSQDASEAESGPAVPVVGTPWESVDGMCDWPFVEPIRASSSGSSNQQFNWQIT